MVVHNFARQNSFALDQGGQRWDPRKVLEIINPDKSSFTCVGFAPSCGRRCRNPIAQSNRQNVYDMLDEISLLSPNSPAVASKLAKIAFLSLCVKFHRDQAEDVVAKWQTEISSIKPRGARVKSWRAGDDPNPPKTAPKRAAPRTSPQAQQTHHAEKTKASPKPDPMPREEEQNEHKTQEKRRREQERLRRERLEKEQEERHNRARKDEHQQKPNRKLEEEERLKRAEAANEKREWAQAWKSYEERWAIFRANKSIPASSIRSAIPWPVKSSQYGDVKYGDVKMFFLNACPNADSPAHMFKAMQKESLKWHPDKISELFRRHLVGDGEKLVVNLIARVVIEMRAEAQAKRNG